MLVTISGSFSSFGGQRVYRKECTDRESKQTEEGTDGRIGIWTDGRTGTYRWMDERRERKIHEKTDRHEHGWLDRRSNRRIETQMKIRIHQ